MTVTKMTLKEFSASLGRKCTMAPKRNPRTNARPEAALKRALLARLTAAGHWCWVNNSGAIKSTHKGKDRLTKLSPKGSPDIFMVGAGGRLCGIECKAPGKKQNASQVAWQKKAIANDVGYVVVWTVEEGLRAARGWDAVF